MGKGCKVVLMQHTYKSPQSGNYCTLVPTLSPQVDQQKAEALAGDTLLAGALSQQFVRCRQTMATLEGVLLAIAGFAGGRVRKTFHTESPRNHVTLKRHLLTDSGSNHLHNRRFACAFLVWCKFRGWYYRNSAILYSHTYHAFSCLSLNIS